jgi:hypothetical protein
VAPELPELPVAPELPLLPLAPVAPELPLVPVLPEEPLAPVAPELPELPFAPEVPELPELPLVPEVPELPAVPAEPLDPVDPEVPLLPLVPALPAVPDVPLVPDGVTANDALVAKLLVPNSDPVMPPPDILIDPVTNTLPLISKSAVGIALSIPIRLPVTTKVFLLYVPITTRSSLNTSRMGSPEMSFTLINDPERLSVIPNSDPEFP